MMYIRNPGHISIILSALFLLALAVSSSTAVWAEVQTTKLAEHMHGHLQSIDSIKQSVIDGNLKAVRQPATWLAEHAPPDGLPTDWQPFVRQMKDFAQDVADATTLAGAAMGVSDMARTCGACHEHSKLNLEMKENEKPSEAAEDIGSHMQRHRWAVDNMWLGMILPSTTAWNRGTDMLIEVALHPSEVSESDAHDKELKAMARRVHQLGGNGIVAVTPEARSELYSELLTTCAGCHTLVR